MKNSGNFGKKLLLGEGFFCWKTQGFANLSWWQLRKNVQKKPAITQNVSFKSSSFFLWIRISLDVDKPPQQMIVDLKVKGCRIIIGIVFASLFSCWYQNLCRLTLAYTINWRVAHSHLYVFQYRRMLLRIEGWVNSVSLAFRGWREWYWILQHHLSTCHPNDHLLPSRLNFDQRTI